MKIYVASKFERYTEVREFCDQIRALGHQITHDWTRTDEFDKNGDLAETNLSEEKRHQYAVQDKMGVRLCHLLILLDGPYLRGAHWEAGMALALGKEIWIVEPHVPVIFDALPGVHRIQTRREALSTLDNRDLDE